MTGARVRRHFEERGPHEFDGITLSKGCHARRQDGRAFINTQGTA